MVRAIVYLLLVFAAAAPAVDYDTLIENGLVYDGSGEPGQVMDVAIRGDRIVAMGDLDTEDARQVIDARGLAVTPGFINVLSWAVDSLIEDPRAMSDVYQGVTTDIFGEGVSMGPVNDAMRTEALKRQGDIRYDITWTTLGEYLQTLEDRGVAVNVASFVGATTVRVHELGFDDVKPTAEQLESMEELVRDAMREGALGVGASLIYAPAAYAETDELVALAAAAGEFGGAYIVHMRSEGDRLLEAIDETIEIAERAGVPAEIYHLKAAGQSNWSKLDDAISRIESARSRGVRITTDMYTYTAGATGLDAAMPPWVQAGGFDAWAERLQDPEIRVRVADEMRRAGDNWENLYHAAGSAENLLLAGFKNEALKPLTGKTLAEVAKDRGVSPEEAAMDLVVEDGSRVGTVYFLMSEANVARQIQLPYMSFGSDAGAMAPEGVFLKTNPHPRAYGNFARLLGRYVRDEERISLAEAVRRLTRLPAENLQLAERGRIAVGYYADIAVFDPQTIADRATFANPHQLAVGMHHVWVNGRLVLQDGEMTDQRPGRFIKGPGAQ